MALPDLEKEEKLLSDGKAFLILALILAAGSVLRFKGIGEGSASLIEAHAITDSQSLGMAFRKLEHSAGVLHHSRPDEATGNGASRFGFLGCVESMCSTAKIVNLDPSTFIGRSDEHGGERIVASQLSCHEQGFVNSRSSI